MKTRTNTALGMGSAALLTIACARAPSVGTTTTTAARTVARPDAVMHLAYAACDGTCGAPSADARACVRDAAERADVALPATACPHGVDAARLAACVKLVEHAACDVAAARAPADPLVGPGCVGAGLCPAR